MSEGAQIPVWDGNPENLPLWQKFLYNGKEYLAIVRDGLRNVIETDTGHANAAMTVRVAGGKSGNPIPDILIKSGVATAEEVALALEGKGSISNLMMKFGEVLKKQRSPEKWCREKDITPNEIYETVSILRKSLISAKLETLLNL